MPSLWNVRIHGRNEQLLVCGVSRNEAEAQAIGYRLRQSQAPKPPGFVFEVCEHDNRQNAALRQALKADAVKRGYE